MECIKLIREYRGYRQIDVAKRGGCTRSALAKAEGDGVPPSLNLIRDIALGLKVNVWQIFYLEEHPELWNEEGVKQVLEME